MRTECKNHIAMGTAVAVHRRSLCTCRPEERRCTPITKLQKLEPETIWMASCQEGPTVFLASWYSHPYESLALGNQ